MTSIFITGALGALGSNLILRLLQHDPPFKIIATDIVPEVNQYLLDDITKLGIGEEDFLEYYFLDVTQPEKITSLLNQTKPDYIIHLAANLNISRKIEFIDQAILTNFLPIIPILKHAYEHNVTRLLFTGTCEEYGFNNSPFHEQQTVMPVSPYSWAKSLTALTVNFAHQVYELPIVFLRPFTFFGSFQRGTMFIPALFRAIFNHDEKFPMSKGDQLREFNFAEDIADAYIKALTTRNIDGETLNLGRGKGFKLSEIAEEIVKITESPILLQKGALDYRKHELMSIITETDKTNELLDWNTTTTLKEGLKKTYQWYQNHPGFL